MANLMFGSFVWPNDPEKYEEKCVREPVYTDDENGNRVFSGMGQLKRTITGSGAFVGANAYASFRSLLALANTGAALPLIHGVWGTRSVYMTELTSTMEPREDYVAYSFTFLEA